MVSGRNRRCRDRVGIDHLAAADRLAGRRAANDEAIVLQRRDGRPEAKLNPALPRRVRSLAVQEGDAGGELGRAGEEIDLVVLLQRNRRVGQETQAGVEALARNHEPGRGQARRRAAISSW